MKSKGETGENLAVDYLQNKGYVLLERNYRFKKGEIDIIMRKDNTLCFIEVKLRSNLDYGRPEEFVSENQKSLIIGSADNYIHQFDWAGDIRFDILALTQKDSKVNFEHFRDAFY